MNYWMPIAGLILLAGCHQSEAPRSPEAGKEAAAGGLATERVAPAPSSSTRTTAENPGSDRSPPAPGSGRVSQFTPLDPATCKLIEESDEGPYWRRRCGGVGGFMVEWTESDLRQNISVVAPGGRKTSLDLPSKVANGAFDRLGARIEWRGPPAAPPDVLVVRVHVANDQGEDDGGHLAVARLKPSPCLIGVIRPQAGQSEKARTVADGGGACR